MTSPTEATARFRQQKKLLEEGRFFKLICGAGNEDPEQVYKFCLVYTLAGAKSIDLSARKSIVETAIRAIDDAEKLAPEYGIQDFIRPYLTVSVGMKGDPHVRKARIDPEKCVKCDLCIPPCPTDAIPESLVIIEKRCIGCGACDAACPVDAIDYSHKELELEKTLRECVGAGAENIELHAAVGDHDQVIEEWKLVNEVLPGNFVSVCLDRGYLSNHELKRRIEAMLRHSEGRMIVQADGIPMSGGKGNDYNTTLQAIATADIVAKMKLGVHLLLSGGTNSKTMELAQLAGVPFSGASLGTHARKLVWDWVHDPKFPDRSVLEPAVRNARELVETCTRHDGKEAG